MERPRTGSRVVTNRFSSISYKICGHEDVICSYFRSVKPWLDTQPDSNDCGPPNGSNGSYRRRCTKQGSSPTLLVAERIESPRDAGAAEDLVRQRCRGQGEDAPLGDEASRPYLVARQRRTRRCAEGCCDLPRHNMRRSRVRCRIAHAFAASWAECVRTLCIARHNFNKMTRSGGTKTKKPAEVEA